MNYNNKFNNQQFNFKIWKLLKVLKNKMNNSKNKKFKLLINNNCKRIFNNKIYNKIINKYNKVIQQI